MGSSQSKMAQVQSDPLRIDGAAGNNLQVKPPPRPNHPPPPPAISVPDGELHDPARHHEPPTSPTSTVQPRSRRGSFSFLRRSKSRGEIAPPTTTGADGGRKLSRRNKRAVSKEETAKKQVGMAPQLPSYHNLPQMNPPFVNGSSDNKPTSHLPQPPPLSSPSAAATSSYHYSPSINTAEIPVSRSGYNPNAFYQRHLMADRASSREDTPQTAAGSTPSPQPVDPTARTESMTNRGRYSYSNSPGVNGSVSSPRRIRRRKDPTPFK